ncbi:MAG: hypothetical protein ACM3WQ_06250 [Chloroflexota bacterium]
MGLVTSEITIQRVSKQLLPFAAPSPNRAELFTSDFEMATIFSLAELERDKGGGLIAKQPEEEIVFIAKMGYPLWLFSWSELNLIFDGLNQNNHNLPYVSIPEVDVLPDNLTRTAKTRETYLAFLNDTANHLEITTEKKELRINGLITDPQFLTEFDSYRREAKTVEEDNTTGWIQTVLDEAAILCEIREVDDLRKSLQTRTETLNTCIRLLDKTTRDYVNELRDKAYNVKQDFAIEIREEEKIVAPRISHIKEDFDFQMNSMTRSYEKQCLPIQEEKAKLEKSKEFALASIEQYIQEAKTHAENGQSAAEQKWRSKADKTRKEIDEIEDQLKQTEKTLRDLEEKRSLETFKIKEEMETKVREAQKILLELESARDAKIRIFNEEIQRLEESTKQKSDQLNRMLKLLEGNMIQFVSLGKKKAGLEGSILYYVPFYVICLQGKSNRRYFILPPSVVSTVGVFTVLKGALGRARIRSLLVPRYKSMTELIDSIQVLAEENALFEAEINELGIKNNMLLTENAHENIKKGLEHLRTEGWLSDKEADAISQRIT